MIRYGFLTLVCMTFLAVSGLAQTTVTLSFQLSGQMHNCVVHVPSGINDPALVFFIHGANGSGSEFENDTKGDATADQDKFIAAYPSASSDGTAGIWADMEGRTNFPFFLALIDTLDARYHIDRNKIYMTGFSQGGMISYAAACYYSDVFAAVAPVSGHSDSACTLKRPVPLFMTFGTNDITPTPTFVTDLNKWSKLDSCPGTPTITNPYPASNSSSGVTRAVYGPCGQGSSLVMDSIQGEGHQWPAANRLNQANEVWAFFKQYSLNTPTGISGQKSRIVRDPLTASYSDGVVLLGGVGEMSPVRVMDTKGRVVAVTVVAQHRFVFKNQVSGVYTVLAGASNQVEALKFVVP